MTTLLTARPDVRQFQNQINRLFEPILNRFSLEEENLGTGSWVPPVDIAETADRILLRAEVPGMKQEDIDIRFEDGVLTLKGERKFEKEEREKTWHRIERTYGSFVRSFSLPRTIDAENITATYRDGVLDVEVPKREEAKPKQIRIGVKS